MVSKKQLFLIIFLPFTTFAHLEIAEIYPNPLSNEEEYILLKNTGVKKNMAGYFLRDKADHQYILSWELFSQETLKIFQSTSRIPLNNTNEELYLYDPFWNLIDSIIYKSSQKWKILTKKILENQQYEVIATYNFYPQKLPFYPILLSFFLTLLAFCLLWLVYGKRESM